MSPLGLILVFVLQFEAGLNADRIYRRSGRDVVLSCVPASSTDSTCSIVKWLYSRDSSQTVSQLVYKRMWMPPRAARLRLDTSCSLVINNVTAEDAGLYSCQDGRNNYHFTDIYLSVLTVSPSEPDTDPKRDGEVTLQCCLSRHSALPPCNQSAIVWVDEEGTELLGEGVGYKFLGQTNCVSYLSVKRQSGQDRKYTCRLVEEGRTVVETDYTPAFTGGMRDGSNSGGSVDHTYIIVGAAVGMLVLLVVLTAVLIKHRRSVKVTEDDPKPTQQPGHHSHYCASFTTFDAGDGLRAHDVDEPENNLTYATISHGNQRAAPTPKVKEEVEEEEGVTYSTVRTAVRIEADDDPGSLYSHVSKPK